MNAAERRSEIISILIVRHHATTKELASEFDVTVGTIKSDIQAAFSWEGITIRTSIR